MRNFRGPEPFQNADFPLHDRFDCTRCGSKNISFIYVSITPVYEWHGCSRAYGFADAFIACSHCRKGLIVQLHVSRPPSITEGQMGAMVQALSNEYQYAPLLGTILPPTEKLCAPKHTPPEVEKPYLRGVALMNRTERTDSGDSLDFNDMAGGAFRKALEMATLKLCVSKGEKDAELKQRIHKLAENRRIIGAMRDWADRIRVIGNEGMHQPDELTNSEVREVKEFTELFLTFAFTMPSVITSASKIADNSPKVP